MTQNQLTDLLNSFSFYVRKAASEMMPQNWVLEKRNIYDHELLFVEQGKIICTIEDSVYTVNTNEILLIPPRKIHYFSTVGKRLLQTHIHFDFCYTQYSPNTVISFGVIPGSLPGETPDPYIQDDIYERLQLPYKLTLDPIHAQTIKELIHNIIALQTSTNRLSLLDVKKCMLDIFKSILAEYFPENKKMAADDTLFNLVNIIIERQATQKFDLRKIATEIGYSPNHLSFLYKNKYGYTPAKYHVLLKIEKAKGYLSQKSLSVTDISDALGFPSVSDFSRYFKREVGISPYNYQMQNSKESTVVHHKAKKETV